METDKNLIKTCREAWESLASFRRRRRRCRDFASGRQWDDSLRLSSGRLLTEGCRLEEEGRMPVTNNLIGRMVRRTLGQYRFMKSGQRDDSIRLASDPDEKEENDVRGLEEFLISGIALQRVKGPDSWLPGAECVAVSPEKLFFSRFMQPDGSDCRMVGLLHDLPLSAIYARFGFNELSRLQAIMDAFSDASRSGVIPCEATETDFGVSDASGLCRVVEVWRLRPLPLLSVYDCENGICLCGICSESAFAELKRLAHLRERQKRGKLLWRIEVADCLEQSWLSPCGLLLDRRYFSAGRQVPIVMRLYPMIDGEVRSVVDGMIGQQKFINRLVTLLDEILAASAKGVVLYPTDQLPEGMTWAELRRIWASPSAVLPFRRTSKSVMPRQMSSSGDCSGASELLKTQLQLFDEISGAGESGSAVKAAGADVMRMQRQGAAIAMLDLLSAYNEFISRRDRVLEAISGKEAAHAQ